MHLKVVLDIAKEQLKDMSSLDDPDFRLEQAVFDKDDETWDIVVSYLVEKTNKRAPVLAAITSEFQYHRMYKRLTIDKDNNIFGFFIFNKE